MVAFKYKHLFFALIASGLFTHSIGNAQSGRVKIVEIVETTVKNVTVQIKDGEATRFAQSGMLINANSMVCPQVAAKTKVILFLQQEDGGDARPVEVDGSKGCQSVSKLWDLSSSVSVRSLLSSVVNFFKREGGVTIRASASTQGGTRGDTPIIVRSKFCPLHEFKPLSGRRFVYLPEGTHSLTFATKVTKPLVVELVDEKGLVLIKAQVVNLQLDIPSFSFQNGREYQLRSTEDNECKIDIAIEKDENANYSYERAVEMTADFDTAKAFYADLVLNAPHMDLWHPYALSLIRPSGDVAVRSKSNAAWEIFWPHFQKLASEAKQ